jgi:hypothetical protein
MNPCHIHSAHRPCRAHEHTCIHEHPGTQGQNGWMYVHRISRPHSNASARLCCYGKGPTTGSTDLKTKVQAPCHLQAAQSNKSLLRRSLACCSLLPKLVHTFRWGSHPGKVVSIIKQRIRYMLILIVILTVAVFFPPPACTT